MCRCRDSSVQGCAFSRMLYFLLSRLTTSSLFWPLPCHTRFGCISICTLNSLDSEFYILKKRIEAIVWKHNLFFHTTTILFCPIPKFPDLEITKTKCQTFPYCMKPWQVPIFSQIVSHPLWNFQGKFNWRVNKHLRANKLVLVWVSAAAHAWSPTKLLSLKLYIPFYDQIRGKTDKPGHCKYKKLYKESFKCPSKILTQIHTSIFERLRKIYK